MDKQTQIMQPGWQLCTVLERARFKTGKTFYLHGRGDPLGFFEAVALSELENRWLRLPAPCQKHFFGSVPFGKKALKVSPEGVITVFWTTGFGQDWEYQILRYNPSQRTFVYASDWQAWKELPSMLVPKCSQPNCAISYPHKQH